MKEEQIEISLIVSLFGIIFILIKLFLFPSDKAKLTLWRILLFKTLIEIVLLWEIFLHFSMEIATYIVEAGKYLMICLFGFMFEDISIKYFFVYCIKFIIEQSVPMLILFDIIFSIEVCRVFTKGPAPFILNVSYAITGIIFCFIDMMILDGFSFNVYIGFFANCAIQLYTIVTIVKVERFIIGDNKRKFCAMFITQFAFFVINGVILFYYYHPISSAFINEWYPSLILILNIIELYLQCYLVQVYQFENIDNNCEINDTLLNPDVLQQFELPNVTEK